MAEQNPLQDPLQAIQSGQRRKAKELLTRLLRSDQENAEYWLWMSSVVETEKEQVFCLQKALKADPTSVAAKRGLFGLAHAIRVEEKEHGIRTCVVSPGLVETELLARRPVVTPPEIVAKFHADTVAALRQMERDGLVSRRVLPTTPPSVEYRLTALGESLREPLAAICRWAAQSPRSGCWDSSGRGSSRGRGPEWESRRRPRGSRCEA